VKGSGALGPSPTIACGCIEDCPSISVRRAQGLNFTMSGKRWSGHRLANLAPLRLLSFLALAIASANRPGGNITGVSFFDVPLGGKRIGLLHEMLPKSTRFALLLDSNSMRSSTRRDPLPSRITTAWWSRARRTLARSRSTP
jgi:hypothetical protein